MNHSYLRAGGRESGNTTLALLSTDEVASCQARVHAVETDNHTFPPSRSAGTVTDTSVTADILAAFS